MSVSALVEVPLESLPILRDAYKINWPEHILAYNFLDKMIDRFQKEPEQKDIKIFSVDGKIEEDATFIALTNNKDIHIGTLDLTFERLNIGLNLLDFETEKLFMCVKDTYYENLMNFIRNKNLKTLFNDGTVMVHMKCEEAMVQQYKVPDGLVLKDLSLADAEKVNSVWPHRSPGSVKFMESCIKYNKSAGLYDEETGELLAWCLEHHDSALLALQVDENHLRKGYATIVTKAIIKKIAEEEGIDLIANIILANFKSKGLFEKLGFQEIDKNFWIGVEKKLSD